MKSHKNKNKKLQFPWGFGVSTAKTQRKWLTLFAYLHIYFLILDFSTLQSRLKKETWHVNTFFLSLSLSEVMFSTSGCSRFLSFSLLWDEGLGGPYGEGMMEGRKKRKEKTLESKREREREIWRVCVGRERGRKDKGGQEYFVCHIKSAPTSLSLPPFVSEGR